jgi:hypothetical protein
MDPMCAEEEATTVQEQLNELFKDFGRSPAAGGRPMRAFLIESAEDSWELVRAETQWPRECTCEAVGDNWMLVEGETMTCG